MLRIPFPSTHAGDVHLLGRMSLALGMKIALRQLTFAIGDPNYELFYHVAL